MINYYVVTDYDGQKYVVIEEDLPEFNGIKKTDPDAILSKRTLEGPMPILEAIAIVERSKGSKK